MKTQLLVSESIFARGQIPVDLHNPASFEIRVFRLAAELIVLTAALEPKVVVLDLEEADFALEKLTALINQVRFSPDPQRPVTTFLGVGSAEQLSQANAYYESGVNFLLPKNYSAPQMLDALEVLLGLRVRKSERKNIDWPLKLTNGQKEIWEAQAKVINLQCMLVRGERLPVEGLTVFVEGSEQFLPAFHLWAHCWRLASGCLILRFLNPQPAFLQAIEHLAVSPQKSSPLETPRGGSETPAYPQLPLNFSVVQLENTFTQLCNWIRQVNEAPAEWQGILRDLPPAVRAALIGTTEEDFAVGRGYTLKILMEIHFINLQERFAAHEHLKPEDLQTLVENFELEVGQVNNALQRFLMVHAMSKAADRVSDINQVKSDLQKRQAKLRMFVNNYEF